MMKSFSMISRIIRKFYRDKIALQCERVFDSATISPLGPDQDYRIGDLNDPWEKVSGL